MKDLGYHLSPSLKAFQVFGDYKYHDAAYEAAMAVWERGLLKKGFGLCHGVAGNAYALLYVHQTLGDKRFFHRAGQYAKFCEQRGRVRTDQPDRPLSMFEGLAGTIYFLFDFLDPDGAKFPAFVI
jgi:lantibiotic modifying enzyme